MFAKIISVAALLSVVSAHGVIVNAQGEKGPASVGFKVLTNIPRNCTLINPCQQDTTIIRQAEIDANVVNGCGRTELDGNIDIGTETENALAAGQVTQVTAGSKITVTLHQVNDDGAGPYACDLDQTSNAGVITQGVTIANNVPGTNGLSQVSTTDFNMTLTLPSNLACSGASTGNVCTVRCRNNAVAGPFGGCFAIQQTDVAPTSNNASTISTAASLKVIQDQGITGNTDLPVAIAGNQDTGLAANQIAASVVTSILAIPAVVSKASPTETPVAADAAAAVATTTASAAKATGTTAVAAAAKKGSSAKGAGTAAAAKKNGRRSLRFLNKLDSA